MAGNYYFNNQEAKSFGIIFKKGTNSALLTPPGAWPDETRELSLPIYICGKDESDFWGKFNAFRAFIQTNESFIFHAENLYRRFNLKYKSISSFTMLTRIKSSSRVYCDLTLGLIDDYPDDFSTTRSGNFLNPLGQSVQFSRTYSSYSLEDAIVIKNADLTFNTDGQTYANKN